MDIDVDLVCSLSDHHTYRAIVGKYIKRQIDVLRDAIKSILLQDSNFKNI